MKTNYKISIIIAAIMLLGILLSSFFVYTSYSKVIKDNTKNIAELSTMNIYSEINNELTKPIYVSLTMANDSFLKEWINNEGTSDVDDVINYLNGIKEKYSYNSVFLVSAESLKYYHYNGINKIISPTDNHDVWYYTFLESSDTYSLDVDIDEVSGMLTIFVNVKITDDLDNVTAVVGVGLEMGHIQEIMSSFEEEYNLEVYLVDDQGLVQSHTTTSNIETLNIFTVVDPSLKDDILITNQRLNTTPSNHEDMYIISRLVDEIDWYLIVTKDTNVLSRFMIDYFIVTVIMIGVIISMVLVIVTKTLTKYQNRIFNLAKTDYLTLLLNRRGFNDEYSKYNKSKEALVFITDIDRFKIINDKYGHSEGDIVLRKVAKIINDEVSKYGKLSRWGGDEFTGVMVGNREIIENALQNIFTKLKSDENLKSYKLSISLGYTYTNFDIEMDEVLSKADKGLYLAKSKGGNHIEFIE